MPIIIIIIIGISIIYIEEIYKTRFSNRLFENISYITTYLHVKHYFKLKFL